MRQLVVLVALLALSLAPGNPKGGPNLPAEFIMFRFPFYDTTYEPSKVGYGDSVRGCGYVPGIDIVIKDEVIYGGGTYWGHYFTDPLAGTKATMEYSIGLADTNGCMGLPRLVFTEDDDWVIEPAWTWYAWGFGGHTLTAYQTISGNHPKKMALLRQDVYPIEFWPDPQVECLLYAKPPVPPTQRYVCP